MLHQIAEALMTVLPHGSGIDCDWTYEVRNTSIRFKNSYHCMNELGFYDGYQDFSLIIYFNEGIDFRVVFHEPRVRTNSAIGLREYLEDVFGTWIELDFKRFFSADGFSKLWHYRINAEYHR